MKAQLPINKRELPLRVIRSGQFEWPLSVKKIWSYREVFLRLFLREMQVRYRQTFLGFLWAWIQPTIAMGIFTLMLGRMAKLPSDNMPYSVFALSGLVLWYYFSNCLLHTSNTFLENRDLIKQVYFPRILIPLSVISSKLVDLGIGMVLLFIWCSIKFPIQFTPKLFLLLPNFLFVFLLILGAVLFLSAMCVRYRDVRYAIPFLIQVWFFSTPIVYSISIASPEQKWIFLLNPMAIAVQVMRDALFNLNNISMDVFVLLGLVSLAVCILGSLYFRTQERTFSDII